MPEVFVEKNRCFTVTTGDMPHEVLESCMFSVFFHRRERESAELTHEEQPGLIVFLTRKLMLLTFSAVEKILSGPECLKVEEVVVEKNR